MRTSTTLAALALLAAGCNPFGKKDAEPAYSPTSEVVRRSAPPPILVNPVGRNADGMLAYQIGDKDFLMSKDRDALHRSVASHCTITRDRTGVTEVRVGDGRQATDTDDVKKLEEVLKAAGFAVTVVEKEKVEEKKE